MTIDLLNIDCMEYMASLPDKAFDLACVDPPYGILSRRIGSLKGAGKLKGRVLNRMGAEWDMSPPPPEYFQELFRVSVNQIIWGGNYFDLRPTRCVGCWDKEQPWENFSQWEMAWTSFDRPAWLFKRGNGLQEPGKIHPTQKPAKLYEYLLHKFAEPGMKILDTHGGSMSIAIACHYAGYDLTLCEIDKDYYEAGVARFNEATAQQAMAL